METQICYPKNTLCGWGFPAACAAVVALLIAGPSSALAQNYQFKFLMTVQVKNLHPYAESVEALCSPKDANGNFITYDIAHSPTDVGKLDATGSFSGTLSHSVKLYNPEDTTKAKKYSCFIRIWSGGMAHVPQDCPDPMSIFYCLKPGTPRTLTVEGTIP